MRKYLLFLFLPFRARCVDGKTRSAGHRNARPEIPNCRWLGELFIGRHACW